jgi:hypothetical protein
VMQAAMFYAGWLAGCLTMLAIVTTPRSRK